MDNSLSFTDLFLQSFDELQTMLHRLIDYYKIERYYLTIVLNAPLKFTQEQVGYLTLP
jgi:hypothetical protein